MTIEVNDTYCVPIGFLKTIFRHIGPWTILYTNLNFTFVGTYIYVDGTKNLINMKKRLRFLMPHTPLKVLRSEDLSKMQDDLHEAFKAPPTTTDDSDVTRDTFLDDVATDIGDVREKEMFRIAGSIDSSNRESFSSLSEGQEFEVFTDEDDAISTHEVTEMPTIVQVHDDQH